MLSGSTRLVGLIGDPVGESLSPRMQNAAFAARGLDWAYVPLPVESRHLEDAIGGLVALGFAGANVTAPHKTQALAYCDELDEFAMRAGSVNTLVVHGGQVHGSSTDGAAVVGALDGASAGARVLVLGAGGAAQAVATALLEVGVGEVAIAARSPDSAAALSERLRSLFPRATLRALETWPPSVHDAEVLVNCTPVRDGTPVDPSGFRTVVDLAYRPDGELTALCEAARAAGCELVVDGLEVLARQGALSFERWTGVSAPLDVMRAAIRA
jgi:shikimate dehydrogenase